MWESVCVSNKDNKYDENKSKSFRYVKLALVAYFISICPFLLQLTYVYVCICSRSRSSPDIYICMYILRYYIYNGININEHFEITYDTVFFYLFMYRTV